MKKVFLASFFSFFIFACTAQNKEQIEVVSVAEVSQALQQENKIQLVDVRTPEEYAEGKIADAININVLGDDFMTEIEKLDKEKPVYIYCKSGKRSSMAAKKMSELGFVKIYDLNGGITSWETKRE